MPCNALKYKCSNTLCVEQRKTYREVFHRTLCHWPQQTSWKSGNDPWKLNPVAALNNTILWATLQPTSCNISLELAQDVDCWTTFALKIKDFRCVSTFWFFPTMLFNGLAAVCNFILPCKIQSMFQRAEKDKTRSHKLFLAKPVPNLSKISEPFGFFVSQYTVNRNLFFFFFR